MSIRYAKVNVREKRERRFERERKVEGDIQIFFVQNVFRLGEVLKLEVG